MLKLARISGLLLTITWFTGCEQQTTEPAVDDLEPLFSAVVTTSNWVLEPFSALISVGCANGGAGEYVLIEGRMHGLSHMTINERGGKLLTVHLQYQGATGTGQTTGHIYRASNSTMETYTRDFDKLPLEVTSVGSFRLIGHGRENNFLLHHITHITINANGDLTANIESLSAECR